MTTNMTYRRFIPPSVPSGQAAGNSVFALLMLARLRNKDKEEVQQKVGLDHWEDEGGSLAETHVATLRSPSSDRPRLKRTV